MRPCSVGVGPRRHGRVRPHRDPAAEAGPADARALRPCEQSPTCCRQSKRQEENLERKNQKDAWTLECWLQGSCCSLAGFLFTATTTKREQGAAAGPASPTSAVLTGNQLWFAESCWSLIFTFSIHSGWWMGKMIKEMSGAF